MIEGATLVTKRFTISAWRRTPLKAAPTPPRAITTPDATEDNGSCVYASGCDSCSGASDGSGSVVDGDSDDDGVCDEDEIVGCQDEGACNFNPDATDAATCEYAADGFDCDGNPLSCAEDINGNGTVEVSDVLLLLSDFGCTSDCTDADIDGDGAVSVAGHPALARSVWGGMLKWR